ncbi:hypothetical protein ACIPW5_25680 [Streptomyces sp. NPDC090077]|uniref:hypothetical protein n=1 Tax=Streptomyces sp. NPDC090077 TaxID=3365938 RepID=UPI0038239E30
MFLLTDSLHHQAVLAGDDPVTAKRIGRSNLLAIHAFTGAQDEGALALLRALHREVLQAG